MFMEQKADNRQEQIQNYKRAVEPLVKYLAWLEKNAGKAGSSSYQGQGIGKHSMSFPVYDSNLLNFVREAAETPLMDMNYKYVYTRNRIRSHEDERKAILAAELKDWDVLCGILSKYVLGGRTKATLWSEAVEENIFFLIVKQMQKIIKYWDKDKS